MSKAFLFRRKQNIQSNEERAGKSPALLFVIALLIICVLYFALPLSERLIVSQRNSEKVLLSLPIEKGEVFKIAFIHSLNLSPVTDCYEWTGDLLILRSTIFKTYGAGIPILDDGLGTGFLQTEEGFQITGIDAPRQKIDIMLQLVPDHRILYSDREIRLLEYANSGTIVSIYVGKISLFRAYLTRLQTP